MCRHARCGPGHARNITIPVDASAFGPLSAFSYIFRVLITAVCHISMRLRGRGICVERCVVVGVSVTVAVAVVVDMALAVRMR